MRKVAAIFIALLALALAAVPAVAEPAKRVDVLIGFERHQGAAEEAVANVLF